MKVKGQVEHSDDFRSSEIPLGEKASPDACYRNCHVVCTETIIMADLQGILCSYNPGVQDLLGYSPVEVIGKPLHHFIGGGKRTLEGIKKQLLGQEVVHGIEAELIGKDKTRIPVNLSASWLKDSAGHCNGFIALCHDLRPIRNLETQIHRKDQFFASILRNSADGIITLDTEERITSWNKGAEAMYGYTEREMLGRTLEVLIPEELKLQRELEKISQIARTEGFLRSYQTERITKNGQRIDVIFTRTAIKDSQGKLIGFSSVMKDVTQQKLSERHLAQMEKLSAIGEVAAGLAHEIKNPLAGIKGAIEIIREGMAQDHPHRTILTEVLFEVSRIDRTVMNLLSYSKPRKPYFVKTNLVGLVGNTISLIQSMADSKNIFLQVQCEANLPPMMGDENDLRQLFMNLLLNSIEAVESRGQIWINFQTLPDKRLCVEVADDGPGIPQHDLGKIFQPFYTTKKQGTGLGLATCRRIVLDHGGEIRVESELGKGTRFIIEFPLNRTAPMSLSSR